MIGRYKKLRGLTGEMSPLTPREIDVLLSLCEQYTAREIAEQLCISKRTVEIHKANLLSKTGARNIAGLIVFALKNDFINLNELVV